MRLRRATEADREAIIEADRLCFPADSPPEPDEGAWWIGQCDGQLAAYCAARPSSTAPGTVYLCRAGVMPDWRGRGLQRRLVHVRERWARAQGYTRVVTDTYRNPASANTLIHCGYRMWEPEYPWGRAGACYWVKSLR